MKRSRNLTPYWLELLMRAEEMELARQFRRQQLGSRPVLGFTSKNVPGDFRREIHVSLAGGPCG